VRTLVRARDPPNAAGPRLDSTRLTHSGPFDLVAPKGDPGSTPALDRSVFLALAPIRSERATLRGVSSHEWKRARWGYPDRHDEQGTQSTHSEETKKKKKKKQASGGPRQGLSFLQERVPADPVCELRIRIHSHFIPFL